MPQDSVASHVNWKHRNASRDLVRSTQNERLNEREGVIALGTKGIQKIEIRCHCDCLTYSATLKMPIHNWIRIKLELHKWFCCLYFDFHFNKIIRYHLQFTKIVLSMAKDHFPYFPCSWKQWQNHHSFTAVSRLGFSYASFRVFRPSLLKCSLVAWLDSQPI